MRKVLFYMSVITMVIAGGRALFEIDIKKIIALSTLRQLGLIIIRLAIGFEYLAFYHLLTHALFKACLFLCAGGMIHLFGGGQDIRKLRRISLYIPFTRANLGVASLALGGAPFLAGFYSKDKILEVAGTGRFNFFCVIVFYFSVFLTLAYRFRLAYYVMIRSYRLNYLNAEDRGRIRIPAFILARFAIVGGRLMG